MRKKLRDKEYWLSLFGVIAFYCMGMSNALNENNTTYALEQINQYDGSIFANNFAVYNSGMSARFFMNFVFGLGMKITNGSWSAVAIPFVYLGVVVLAVATVEIVFNISEKYRLFLVCILAFFLKNSVNTGFPGWGSFELTSIGMGTAYAFTMLAFSQVTGKEKKWNTAWIILSIAALCHVHEGLWGFCLLFIIYVCQVVEKKSLGSWKTHWAFFMFVIVLGICVIPGVFGESSGLTNAEFVDIYAYYRTPHHLVPSAWGLSSILKYLAVIVGTALIRCLTLGLIKKEQCKEFYLEAGLAIVSWIAAIGVVYFFTEVIPVASIVTMYIPKYLKYVGILSQIWCIKCIYDWVEKEGFMIAALTAVTVFCASSQNIIGVAIFYGVFVVAVILWKKFEVEEMKYLLPIEVLGVAAGISGNSLIYAIGIISFIYCIVLWDKWEPAAKVIHNTAFVVVMSALMIFVTTKDRVWTISDGSFRRVTANSYLVNGMGEELYGLAMDFENTTGKDDVFISDPNASMTCWFQLGSKRNGYTNNKNVPAAQCQIKEWYERIIETQGLFDKETTEIYTIMTDTDLEYILVNTEYYEKFDASEIFEARNISANDQYRIYQIR